MTSSVLLENLSDGQLCLAIDPELVVGCWTGHAVDQRCGIAAAVGQSYRTDGDAADYAQRTSVSGAPCT